MGTRGTGTIYSRADHVGGTVFARIHDLTSPKLRARLSGSVGVVVFFCSLTLVQSFQLTNRSAVEMAFNSNLLAYSMAQSQHFRGGKSLLFYSTVQKNFESTVFSFFPLITLTPTKQQLTWTFSFQTTHPRS